MTLGVRVARRRKVRTFDLSARRKVDLNDLAPVAGMGETEAQNRSVLASLLNTVLRRVIL